MRRLFGSKKDVPAPSLTDAVATTNERADVIQLKIKKLDQELLGYRQKMAKMKPGPGLNTMKQRALRVLKQKKMYESQYDQLQGQAFNLEQTSFATETLKDTVTTVSAMKGANKALKQQFKEISVTDVESMQDDLADMLEDANDIQDVLGRSYDIGEDIDEADLEAELEGLEDEMMMEGLDEADGAGAVAGAEPSYLVDAPAVPVGVPVGEPDEFGLPRIEQPAQPASAQ